MLRMKSCVQKLVSEKRAELGLSRVEFAALLGAKYYNVAKWENGDSHPKANTLLKIMALRKK